MLYGAHTCGTRVGSLSSYGVRGMAWGWWAAHVTSLQTGDGLEHARTIGMSYLGLQRLGAQVSHSQGWVLKTPHALAPSRQDTTACSTERDSRRAQSRTACHRAVLDLLVPAQTPRA